MATRYHKGRAKEYEAKALLERLGYHVTRSAGSKGLIDIIGVRHDEVLLIQCKYSESGDDWNREDSNCQRLRDLPVPFLTKKELWIYLKGQGLTEIRDLKLERPDSRSYEGKTRREADRQRAQQLRALSKASPT